MKKSTMVTPMLLLVLGVGANVSAQPMGTSPGMGPGMTRQTPAASSQQRTTGEWGEHMGPWMMGRGTGPWGFMGPGMMGFGGMGWGSMMGPGLGMMGEIMDSPELLGTMLSIHGDVLTLMGRMVEKYGSTTTAMTDQQQNAMRKDFMEGVGEILAKHGNALKEKAKAVGK